MIENSIDKAFRVALVALVIFCLSLGLAFGLLIAWVL